MSSDPAMKSAGLVEAPALSANSAHARTCLCLPSSQWPSRTDNFVRLRATSINDISLKTIKTSIKIHF